MSQWAKDPDRAAQELMAGAMAELALEQPLLWAGAAQPSITKIADPLAAVWNRRCQLDGPGIPEPPAGPFASALLRLPKSRAEQLMSAHLCLGALAPNGRLIVYGGNDEGIRSFQKILGELGPVATLVTRGHGRILELKRQDVTAPLQPMIADWRHVHAAPAGVTTRSWVSYPGLFAGGAPDPGTLLLLEHLPHLPDGATVLDYGAGPGAISAHLQRTMPAVRLSLLDNDSVALLAAAENVAGATLIAGDRLGDAVNQRYDLIVSNPPLHVGFKEDTGVLHRLIADAPANLKPGGTLLLVVQARIMLDRTLAASFTSTETLANNGRYRVWRGTGAKQK